MSEHDPERRFLLSQLNQVIEHEEGSCGDCEYRRLMAQVAREVLDSGDTTDGIRRWAEEVRRRWEDGDFARLHREARAAGKDPAAYFHDRGITP
jgi:hypothetical protein